MLVSATLNNLHISTLNTVAFLLLLSKLRSAPFPLKQLLLITCKLTIAYFWLSCNQCSDILSNLKQPSSFTTLAFLLLLSKLPSAPIPLRQLLFITCTLMIAYFFFPFIVVTDAHLSHFKPSSFKVKYSWLFVVAV